MISSKPEQAFQSSNWVRAKPATRAVSTPPLSQSGLMPTSMYTSGQNYTGFPSFHLLLPTHPKEPVQHWSSWGRGRKQSKESYKHTCFSSAQLLQRAPAQPCATAHTRAAGQSCLLQNEGLHLCKTETPAEVPHSFHLFFFFLKKPQPYKIQHRTSSNLQMQSALQRKKNALGQQTEH